MDSGEIFKKYLLEASASIGLQIDASEIPTLLSFKFKNRNSDLMG